ncbi:MAG: 6-carboxytetrahydropterin synthase [Deltaproteobacteria bacterium]|nr:6-carboxytetrahydropterin synthase [Deltaproteobacteria bacterium]
MLVTREVSFRARHSHKGMILEPEHEHEFTVLITIKGEPNEEGFIVDFRAIKRLFLRAIAELEGKNLDTIFEYPTSENLAVWIGERLAPFFPLHLVEVREKPHSRVIFSRREANGA